MHMGVYTQGPWVTMATNYLTQGLWATMATNYLTQSLWVTTAANFLRQGLSVTDVNYIQPDCRQQQLLGQLLLR